MDILSLAHNGIPAVDLALTLNRVALGTFFAISGYHKLFDAGRHATIARTMVDLKIPFPRFNEWWVPGWEFTAGLLVLFGVFAPFAAGVLVIICLVATVTDGVERIRAWHPIDKADVLDDVLYLPEVLYILGLSLVITAPGFTWIHLAEWIGGI